MTSKSLKLRIKRRSSAGRPRKEDVERFPSGKIKPSETQKETKAVALWARNNIHGIDADDPHAGSTLGRLFLDRKISEDERKAGEYYAECMARYYSATGIPHPSPKAQNFGAVRGHDGDVSESQQTRARRATNRMMELEQLLLSRPNGPRIKSTLFGLCVEDLDILRMMPAHQLILAKEGLMALMLYKSQREPGQ